MIEALTIGLFFVKIAPRGFYPRSLEYLTQEVIDTAQFDEFLRSFHPINRNDTHLNWECLNESRRFSFYCSNLKTNPH